MTNGQLLKQLLNGELQLGNTKTEGTIKWFKMFSQVIVDSIHHQSGSWEALAHVRSDRHHRIIDSAVVANQLRHVVVQQKRAKTSAKINHLKIFLVSTCSVEGLFMHAVD